MLPLKRPFFGKSQENPHLWVKYKLEMQNVDVALDLNFSKVCGVF